MTSATKNNKNEAAEFLDNFTDFLGDSEGQSFDDIRKELIEEGIDVDSVIASVKSTLEEKISEAKRAWLKEAPVKRVEILKSFNLNKVDAEIPEDSSEFHKLIENIIISGDKEFALAFRNFKDLPDEDLRRLYSEYLQLLSLRKGKK